MLKRLYTTSNIILADHIQPLVSYSQITSDFWCYSQKIISILLYHTHRSYPASCVILKITFNLVSHSQIISKLWCHTHRSHITSNVILTDHIQPLKAYSHIISILWRHTYRSHPASTAILTDNIQSLITYSQIISNLQCQIHK